MLNHSFNQLLTSCAAAISVAFLAVQVSALGQEVKYGIGSWTEAGRGNHRALVSVTEKSDAVWAHIPWRRRDRHPEEKDIRIFDAATGKRITNVVRVNVNREYGDFVFQPATVPGGYEIYYLPYNPPGTGPFGEGGDYFPPENTASPKWVVKHGLDEDKLKSGTLRSLPQAELIEIQARGEFHRMDPMEVIATKSETAQLLARCPNHTYLLFPEDRRHPIRMFEDLPYRWTKSGPSDELAGEAQPGEYYCFQIGVWAARESITDLDLQYGDLASAGGKRIPSSAFHCTNLGGRDWRGRPLRKTFPVGKGKVRPLWIAVQIPKDATGDYSATISVRPKGADATDVKVQLRVRGPAVEDAGDNDLWRYSRLRWLDSTLGIDDGVIPPFTPLEVAGDGIRCLGRVVRFSPLGLPASIQSSGREILAEPVALVVETAAGRAAWKPGESRTLKTTPGAVERETTAQSSALDLIVRSRMEFDGCILYQATLSANKETDIRDIRLDVPLRREVAKYMMGMSRRGGYRPKEQRWKWNVNLVDNMVWLGDFDAGLQLKLRGATDAWRLRDFKETGVPQSWSNDGKGGCDITEEGDRVLVAAYTGPRRLEAGQELELRFRLLITPFKPIDRNHWNWRYGDVKGDANILHVHHSAAANPYINYPFLAVDRLTNLVGEVKAIRHKEWDFGGLAYPAEGAINLDRGALHVWVRINFDPKAGEPRQAQYNQSLFSLDFPNEDQLGFYWNIDDHGMRTYCRTGPPWQNQYPVLFGAASPDWRKGQRHCLTLSWGDKLAIFVDGKQLRAVSYKGILKNSLQDAALHFRGGGFILDAIKITDTPFHEGMRVAPSVDRNTLLLDTFAAWDGGKKTHPEKIAGGGFGELTGIYEADDGVYGKSLKFSSRKVEIPPKGVNIYYTVRELSNHAAEMWALRSLGDEVFKTGGVAIYLDPDAVNKPAKGYPWLREHLITGYIPAWRTALGGGDFDAAIATQGLSRWHNYYVEGLRWLMEHTGFDGLYLDGIGYDREIMKRVAKVMHRVNPNSRINFHSGDNWRPPWDSGRTLSAANQYMEHFPYISNLWFGELFDYNAAPDYWLVEISGIPFGLTGEMLNYQNGGNPYRGMIYGMTGRQHPSAPAMWRFWDEFGIQDAEMIGYWDPRCPVHTDRDDVLATVYRKKGKSLVALANWSRESGRRTAFVRSAVAPNIDGRLAPNEWAAAAKLTNFIVFGGENLAKEQTEVFITYDAEHLYIGFRCVHSHNTIKAEAAERDGPVWEDDAIEIFIQPYVDNSTYFQFVGNSKGVIADNQSFDMSWNGEWRYKASVGEDYWEGELTIPFDSIGTTPPAEGRQIGFNACRDQQSPSKAMSCWSPTEGTFHNTKRFGRIVFSSTEPLTREETTDSRGEAGQTVAVRLRINWQSLGLNRKAAKLTAPPIAHFQRAAQFSPEDDIPVKRGKGWLLILEGL